MAVLVALHVAYYLPRCVDDLFISLRFAENLARGRGIVFNVGERVEGYSSPLWMLLQSMGLAVGAEGVTWTKLLGIAALVLLLVGTERLAREHAGVTPWAAMLAPLFLALDSHVVAWSVLGLETPAFLALLVWYPIVLRRYLEAPTRRSGAVAFAVIVALACVRPEAPLFLGAIGLGELVLAPRSEPLRARLLAAARLGAPVLAVLGALLLARHAYFGAWLPNTYYVKGATSGWELAKLGVLVRDGAAPSERLFYLGGVGLAIALAVTRRAPSLLAGIVCALFFTASVERDWMPSLRHLLPVPVLAVVGWAWAVDRLARSASYPGLTRYAAAVVASFILVCGVQLASVDVRLSVQDKREDRPWAVPKTAVKASDAWLSLRGIEPPHVATLGAYEMGLITQNYRVLEAAAAPLEDSWFVGRDIGQVGYYTDVRIFDTPGLFTPTVVKNEAWQREHRIDGELVRAAFAHKPVAAEILDAWTPALAAQPDLLAAYDVVSGSTAYPVDLMQSDRPLPAPSEVLRRYEQSLARFPRAFVLATLYGESSGGAMRRRVRRVREIVAASASAPDPTPRGREQGAGAMLEGTIESLGCAITPATVHAGETVEVDCTWRAVATPSRAYWTFLHFDDAGEASAGPKFQEDHPSGAFVPSNRWRPGELIKDTARVTVPARARHGVYRLYFGMWKGDTRPAVTPRDMSDGKDRVAGPKLVVE